MAVFYEYNREAAVSYARRWALGRNPAYMGLWIMGWRLYQFYISMF